uniref:basic proline-rich protein-like n=1 Tax=Panthera onca TaxID=9690 RepID=UPI0029535E7D|nr:basic proline-rich protein-like [Panthera onca]
MAAAARCQGTRLLLLLLLLLLLRAPHPGAARPRNARPRPPQPSPSAAGSEGPRGSRTNGHSQSRLRQHPTELPRTITAAAAPPPRLRVDPEVLRPPAPPEERGGAPHAGRAPPAGAPPSQSPAPRRRSPAQRRAGRARPPGPPRAGGGRAPVVQARLSGRPRRPGDPGGGEGSGRFGSVAATRMGAASFRPAVGARGTFWEGGGRVPCRARLWACGKAS